MVRCGADVGLKIEVCGAVRAPALDDGAVRGGCGPLHCGAVRSRAKLLGPRRALTYSGRPVVFVERPVGGSHGVRREYRLSGGPDAGGSVRMESFSAGVQFQPRNGDG